MKPLETELEKKVCRWAKQNGVLQSKLKIEGRRGWPDRAFWLPGGPLMIEFKRAGEEPTKLQHYIHTSLRKQGYDVRWTDNYEVAIRWLEEFRYWRGSKPAAPA
jgi:hypothetical protein